MATIGSAEVLIRPSFRGLNRAIEAELGSATERAGRTGGSALGESLSRWGRRGALAAGAAVVGTFGASLAGGFNRLRAIEEAQAKMRGLGHDADSVRQIMDNALGSVRGTAFGLGEAATVAASAVAAGIQPGEELQGVLTTVANSAAAASIGMDEMGSIFNKVASTGKAQNDSLQQVADRGIPIYQALADQLGVTTDEVFRMASAGEINFQTFETAMESAAGTVSAEMGTTFTGTLSNLWASISRIGANLLSGAFPKFSTFFSSVTDLLGGLEDKAAVVGEKIGDWLGRAVLGAQGMWDLVINGDFTGKLREAFGWEEDSWQVGAILDARDAIGWVYDKAVLLGNWIRDIGIPALMDVGGWIKDNRTWLLPLAGAIAAGTVAWTAHSIAVTLTSKAYKALQFAALRREIGLLTTRIGLLNLAMLANPVGLIVAGIAALVAGFVIAWHTSETFRNVVMAVWDGIKTAAMAVVSWFTDTAWPALQAVWDGISAGAKWLWENGIQPAWEGIKTGFEAVGSALAWVNDTIIQPVWNALVAGAQWVWDLIGPPLTWIGETFFAVGKWIYDVVFNVILLAFDLLVFGAKWLWENGLRIVFGAIMVAWDAVGSAIKWAWENVIKPVWHALQTAATWLWESVLKPVFSWIASGFDDVANAMKWAWENIIQPTWSALQTAATWMWENILSPVFGWIGGAFETLGRGIKSVWDDWIRPAWEALGNFLEDHVLPGVQRGVDLVVGAFRRIANLFAAPINFVLDTVWNNGIKWAFDKVADAIGSSARLPAAPTIPNFTWGADNSSSSRNRGPASHRGAQRAFAKGGLATPGWALVGEEGPELVNFSDTGRVYTALETARALAAGRDLDPSLARRAAGSSPEEAVAPMGDNVFGTIGSAIGDAAGAVVGWVRGGMAAAASALIEPLFSLVDRSIGQWGDMGGLVASSARSYKDKLIDWIRGEDEEYLARTMVGVDKFDPAMLGGAGIAGAGAGGGWLRPGPGPVTSRFGPRWGGHHAGIDLAMPIGTPVKAPFDGRVIRSGFGTLAGRTGLGLMMMLNNGFGSYFGHLSRVFAADGQQFRRGQILALSGNTGNSTGPHLHFEVNRGNFQAPINPTMTGLFDTGGILHHGAAAMNLSGKPEAILTNSQWQMLESLASTGGFPDTLALRVGEREFVGYVEDIAHAEDRAYERVGGAWG